MSQTKEGETMDSDAADQNLGENGEVATHESAENQQPIEQPVESAQDRNWKQVNETLSDLKRQNYAYEQRQQQLEQQLYQRQQPAQEHDPFNGKARDDFPDVESVDRFVNHKFSKLEQQMQQKFAESQQRQIESSLRSRDPNYEGVIGKYRDHLTSAQKAAALNAPDPLTAAYEMCVNSAAYYKDELQKQQHGDAAKAKQNLSKTGSASGAGLSGALGHAQMYERMSDDELLQMGNRFARGG